MAVDWLNRPDCGPGSEFYRATIATPASNLFLGGLTATGSATGTGFSGSTSAGQNASPLWWNNAVLNVNINSSGSMNVTFTVKYWDTANVLQTMTATATKSVTGLVALPDLPSTAVAVSQLSWTGTLSPNANQQILAELRFAGVGSSNGPNGGFVATCAAGSLTGSTKTGPAVATAGSVVSYTIIARNTGNAAVTNVTLTDAPSTLTGVTVTPVSVPTIAPGSSATFTVIGTIPSGFVGQITNTATLMADGGLSLKVGPVVTTVTIPKGNVSGARKTGPATALPDSDVTWQIVVPNSGDAPLTNIVVLDVPPILTGVSITPSLVAAVPPGKYVVFTVTGHVPSNYRGPIKNTATVTADNGIMKEVTAYVMVTESVEPPLLQQNLERLCNGSSSCGCGCQQCWKYDSPLETRRSSDGCIHLGLNPNLVYSAGPCGPWSVSWDIAGPEPVDNKIVNECPGEIGVYITAESNGTAPFTTVVHDTVAGATIIHSVANQVAHGFVTLGPGQTLYIPDQTLGPGATILRVTATHI
jgi:uncharacterized repeat protein (TIGR01451 family)